MKRIGPLVLATTVVAACVIGVSGASAVSTLPTLNVVVTGKTGIAVSGSTMSGAVNVTSTFTGKGRGGYGLVRLDPGVSFQEAFQAVQSHHGNPDALTPFASIVVSADAPSTVETLLTPGKYVALNLTGNGPAQNVAHFTVRKSSSPASLPAAAATETSIEFGFKGPSVLHNGSIVRTVNAGFLVHMDNLVGARNKADAEKIVALLKAGEDHQAEKLATGSVDLMNPASPGGIQQQVLDAKPGYYVQACFMDTLDGREHTVLGMDRVVRVAS